MTDIVERLQRAMHDESALYSPRTTGAIEAMRAAQDEIGQLQMELRALRQDNGAVIAGLQGEVERLKETDRLREAAFDAYAAQERQDRAKIDELNAALYKIVERDHFDDATIARKALGLPTTDRETP